MNNFEEKILNCLNEEEKSEFENWKNQITEDVRDEFEQKLNEAHDQYKITLNNFMSKILSKTGMEELKIHLGLEDFDIDQEVKELIRECKDALQEYQEKEKKLLEENRELWNETYVLKSKLYVHEKVKGLPLKRQEKAFILLEDVFEKNKIDEKLKLFFNEEFEKDPDPSLLESKTVDFAEQSNINNEDSPLGGLINIWKKQI